MRVPVQFNCQVQLRTIEIHNERTDRLLPPELATLNPIAPELPPETTLRRSSAHPQLLRAREQSGNVLSRTLLAIRQNCCLHIVSKRGRVHIRAPFPLTLALSLRGRGNSTQCISRSTLDGWLIPVAPPVDEVPFALHAIA